MQGKLDKATMLSMKDLNTATIASTILTAIMDLGAFTTYVQPTEEQVQVSECGQYIWNDPLSITNEKSDTFFRWHTATLHPAKI